MTAPMTGPMTEEDARDYLDLSFTPLKAAIDRGDRGEIARIVAALKGDGRQDLADIALDLAVTALHPQGLGS